MGRRKAIHLAKADSDGIRLLKDEVEEWRVPWDAIRRIEGYAEDNFTIDTICLWIESDLGKFRLSEDIDNFNAFCGTLGNHIEILEPLWMDRFTTTAFSKEVVLLYERPAPNE